MNYFFKLALFFIALPAMALTLPPNCKIMPITDGKVALTGEKDALFYINNAHANNVYLANPAQPDLTIKVSPHKWAVLALKEKSASQFQCVESKPGSEQQLPCTHLVKICKLEKLKLPMTIIDNDWLVADVDLSQSYDALALKQINIG